MIDYKKLLKEKNMSMKECSEFFDIPYATLYSIANNELDIKDCSYSIAKKISRFVGIPMEYLDMERTPFITFRSNLHHDIKKYGIIETARFTSMNNLVKAYMLDEQYIKGLYLVSLIEHVENTFDIYIDAKIEKYKNLKLKEPFHFGNNCDLDKRKYIKEFSDHNIMEGNLYDAVWNDLSAKYLNEKQSDII